MIQAIADDSEGQHAPEDPKETASTLVNNVNDESNEVNGQRTEFIEVPMNTMMESLEKASGIVEQENDQLSISSSGEARTEMKTSHSVKAVCHIKLMRLYYVLVLC